MIVKKKLSDFHSFHLPGTMNISVVRIEKVAVALFSLSTVCINMFVNIDYLNIKIRCHPMPPKMQKT